MRAKSYPHAVREFQGPDTPTRKNLPEEVQLVRSMRQTLALAQHVRDQHQGEHARPCPCELCNVLRGIEFTLTAVADLVEGDLLPLGDEQ